MSSKTILRSFAVLFAGLCLSIPLFAQQEDAPSVAEAARRSRQQKQDTAKPAHVIDNDLIPPSSAASTAAPASAPSTGDTNTSKSEDSAAAPKSEADKADDDKKKADIEALKQEIADKLAKVNLQQREITLAEDSYFANPDHEHDKAGKENLDSLKAELTELQAELTSLRAKLGALGARADEKTPETPKP
jgi:chromosome segregation ATPase